jgi:tRNA (guanosine-2'-O-)-methyltransferase
MKRTHPDVFSPQAYSSGVGQYHVPPPGPSPHWTADGVIRTLQPLALPERNMRIESVLDRRLDSVTLLLDSPGDPHNVAAVLRSADAFGIQTVHVFLEDGEYRANKRIAQGSHNWVDTVLHHNREDAAAHLIDQGYTLVTTHPEGKLSPEDLRTIPRLALILGNEHSGVHPSLVQKANSSVQIPMVGFVESLNLSVSAALLLRAATEGRGRGLPGPLRENVHARWLRHSVPRSSEILAAVDAR